MTNSRAGRRLAVAATIVTAAIASASPAYAGPAHSPEHCDARLDALEAQFYDMADRRGYEAASEWWQARWHAYFQSCVIH